MGFRHRFVAGLLLRLGVVLVSALALVSTLLIPGLVATRIVAAVLFAALVLNLWRYIQKTNVELARFVDAVRFGDFSQSFAHAGAGSGFAEFGEALEEGLRRLREEKHQLTDANRFFEAVLDDAPVALLTIDEQTRIELSNKAARRLFTRHSGVQIEDFQQYGAAFAGALAEAPLSSPRLVPILIDAVPQAAIISCAAVHRLGGEVKAIAVQPIQTELNAVELAAQSDLVRVLTHEIMNSMTPVTSLAHSAADLMRRVDQGNSPAISDARSAVETLARRADGVMHFVESYRQISRKPQVRRRAFVVLPWARELEALFRADERSAEVHLALSVEPKELELDADPDLLSQVLINLLKNAGEAASAHSDAPAVSIAFTRAASGRTKIEVADNGPGIPAELTRDIFLPFFTTKAKGTGVGLSLARQIILAHRGSITVEKGPAGGALFRILI